MKLYNGLQFGRGGVILSFSICKWHIESQQEKLEKHLEYQRNYDFFLIGVWIKSESELS
jgi:hypothetical protein